uniref:G_PROTEIN_RECEP_F1_2 domain-containing protein n=1 Tax=Steinernema glaseri TaxID=37863 RepID=A0A1I8A9Y3_9BILA
MVLFCLNKIIMATYDDRFSYAYNRILDLTAVGSIMVKPLCIYIIIKKTPKCMKTVSYFFLNELVCNLAGNLLFTLGHPLPMMPAACIRMDGLAGTVLKSEEQRLAYYLIIVFTIFHYPLCLFSTFLFRYLSLAFKSTISRFHRGWGYLICALTHLILVLFFVSLFALWWTPIRDYPKDDLPDNVENLFCFHPDGITIDLIEYLYVGWFTVGTVAIVLLAVLCVRELRLKRHLMQERTLNIQKEILKNLVIITSTAVLLGGLPVIFIVFYLCNGKLPFAREITSCLMLFVLNYGTLYAILILMLFKSYRKAAADIVGSLMSMLKRMVSLAQPSSDVSPNVVLHRVNDLKY